MKKTILLAALSLLFIANCCRNNNVLEIKTIVINPSDTVKGGFSDYFEVENYIPLQTSDSSVLQTIRKIYIANNKIFILTWGETQILVFDINGKFLNKIGTFGRGPNEYSYVVDFSVSSNGDTICLYDKGYKKTFYYNNHGTLLLTQDLNADLETFMVLPSGNIVGYSYLNYVQPLNDTIYQLWFFKDSKAVDGFLPVSKDVLGNSIGLPSTFNSTTSGNFFIPYTQNIVYNITENPFNISPLYKIDFKERTIPDNILELPRKEMNEAFDKAFILNGEFIGSKDLVFNIYSRELRKSMVAIFNLEKEKHVLFNSDKIWDSTNELTIKVDIQNTYYGRDRLIAISDPVDLLSHDYENAKSLGSILKQKLKETDNPTLVIYKEK